MTDVPATAPVTTPVAGFMIALPLLLLHVPPAGVEFNVVVKPTHTAALPVIAVGLALTVTVAVTVHPVPKEYVIVDVPAAAPVTTPVVDPIKALPLLLLHPPPPGVEFKVVVKPTHTPNVPVIGVGVVLTFTTVVFKQPVPST